MLDINTEELITENIPSANPLVSKGYSLEADMLLGWKPKNINNPVNINFPLEFPI